LEKEIEKLCHTINERTREKEEAIAQLESSVDVFDFRRFLEGRLIKPPQGHQSTVLMTPEENRRFKRVILQRGEGFFAADILRGIIWADGGGGCVVPLPSVLYNGGTQTPEKLRYKPVADHSYQFCAVDERGQSHIYHGTYHCIRVVATDWEHLASLDKKLAEQFLGRVIVGKGLVPPVFVTLIEQLYKTGALKVDCAVLRFEHFDDTTAKQVLSREGPPSIINVPSHSGGKRPSDQDRGRTGNSSKRSRLKR